MKPLLYIMPEDPNDLTLYFENVEKLFALNSVSDDLKVQLMTPYLTDTARRALLGLSADELCSYEH